jgi:predicted PurR-regulated permease PerM
MALFFLLIVIVYLFSSQIISISSEFEGFKDRLQEISAAATSFINQRVPFLPDINEQELLDRSGKWLSDQANVLVKSTLSGTASLITNIILTIIYTFLLLLYRHGLKEAFVNFAEKGKRKSYEHMIRTMQKVGQQYLTGMFTLIIILGLLNTTGLFLIGIDYPFFFGYLAAFLAIIPYVGTTLGGAIPTLYAFMTYDSIWYPVAVVLIFWVIQFLEGNFLNPKIVGGNLNLNALAAIIALIVGGIVWGVPGMILFLPFTAVLKVACEHYEQLKPLSFLLQDNMYPEKDYDIDLKAKIKGLFN